MPHQLKCSAQPISQDEVNYRVQKSRQKGRNAHQEEETWLPIDTWLTEQETHYGAYPYSAVLPMNAMPLDSAATLLQVCGRFDLHARVNEILARYEVLHRQTSFVTRDVKRMGHVACLSIMLHSDGKRIGHDSIAKDIFETIYNTHIPTDRITPFIVEVYDPLWVSDFTVFPSSGVEVGECIEQLRDEAFEIAGRYCGSAVAASGVYKMRVPRTSRSNYLRMTIGVYIVEHCMTDFRGLTNELHAAALRVIDTYGVDVQIRLLETKPMVFARAIAYD